MTTKAYVSPKFKALGYWFNELAPNDYPRPQALVGRWQPARRAEVVAYLRSGTVFERYRGLSYCRFHCGLANRALGACDLFDGQWIWPSGLAHYVEAHDVRLPERFIRHALRRNIATVACATPCPSRPRQRVNTVDIEPWLAWSRRRGACLKIAPWALPPWLEREKLEMRAALVIRAGHPLWQHPKTLVLGQAHSQSVVFALDDNRLAIVDLRKPGAPTRWLTGWHNWPAQKPAHPGLTP